jgi:hypothetical protein
VNYEELKCRVERAERLVEVRQQETRDHWATLKARWREGWTPARIVAAGLVSGFVSGRAEPLHALSSARMLQMISAVSGLFATAQATFAAEQAGQAADTVQDVANDTAATEAAATRTADQREPTAPRPAEAATEVSEH